MTATTTQEGRTARRPQAPRPATGGSTATRIWAVTRTSVVRLVRDRANLFFVFVFPLALVLLLGQQFGGDSFATQIGVVRGDGDVEAAILDDLDGLEDVTVTDLPDADALSDAVARGDLAAGLDLSSVTSGAGASTATFYARPDGGGGVRALVDGVVSRQAVALTAADAAGVERDDALAARSGDEDLGVVVASTTVGEADELTQAFSGLGQFDLTASTQLLLFMFLTSLSGSAALIQLRQWGITRRMLSTPTSTSTILLGLATSRFAIALVQAVWIVAGTLLLFDVDWGDPFASTLVVVLFAAVCAGAAMLMGAAFRNDAQASGAGIGLGLGLSALGGCMVPVEVFPESVSWVVRLTPHGWANEAFAELVRRDGTVLDILPQLGVLALWAVVLLGVATVALRRSITAG